VSLCCVFKVWQVFVANRSSFFGLFKRIFAIFRSFLGEKRTLHSQF
jgi:hypothetical protein